MSILWYPMSALIRWPFAACLIGVGFIALSLIRRRRRVLATGVIWLTYGAYEYLIKARVLCSGDCGIRVDILLWWPVLVGAAAIGVSSVLHRGSGAPPR